MINRKLEDQTLETQEVRSLVNQRGRVKTKIIDFLLSDVIEDSGSRWSEDYARKQISNVIKNWCLSENKAIYIYPDTAMPIIEEREKSKVDASEFIIKRHSGKASGTKRQLCGDLWNLIVVADTQCVPVVQVKLLDKVTIDRVVHFVDEDLRLKGKNNYKPKLLKLYRIKLNTIYLFFFIITLFHYGD